MSRQYFEITEAEALIPRLAGLMGEALQLHAHLRDSIDGLGQSGHVVNASVLSGERELELDDEDQRCLARARMLFTALRENVETIEGTGAEVKGLVDGLLDFRSWRDGTTEVLLCWKLGEPGIGYYHDTHSGYAGRKPVVGHEFTNRRTEATNAQN
ncbi:MAG: DUF2203 domain-containing protein [Nannocystaceae bacterium]